MSFNKLIFLCVFGFLVKNDMAISHCKTCFNHRSDGALSDMAFNTVKEVERIVASGALDDIGKNLGQAFVKEIVASRCLESVGLDAGKNVGLGTLSAVVVSGGAKILACGKVVGTAIVASPVTPYILVGVSVVVVGCITYKVYRYYNPTTGDVIEKNIEIARLHHSQAMILHAQAELKEAQARFNNAEAEHRKSELALHNQDFCIAS